MLPDAATSSSAPKDLPNAVRELESRGRTESRIAVGAFAVGGAAVVAGAVLVYLNQPRRVRVDETGGRIALRPFGAGLALSLGY
jgi:hypothetical protein